MKSASDDICFVMAVIRDEASNSAGLGGMGPLGST
jgi:hypothetical protein